MSDRGTSSKRARSVVALLAAVMMLAWPTVASAHTEFESSVPSDGTVVEAPLAEVVLNFTNPARPAGDGFQLLDPTGQVRTPTSVDETDGTSFVLSFDPPLTAGTYGFRWQVQAGDAHPIDGSFRFEVTEPVVATVAPASTTPAEAAPAPVTAATPSSTPAPAEAAPAPATAATPSSTRAPAEVTPAPTATIAGATDAATSTPASADPSASLETFLRDSGSSDEAILVGRVGRTLTFLGLIFGLGALAALVWVIRGRRDELLTQLAWIRLAGLVVATGGLVELAALRASQTGGALDLFNTTAGIAAALKMVGGVAVLIGFHARAGHVGAPPQALSAAVAADIAPGPGSGEAPIAPHRWEPTGTAWLGLAGFVLVLVSFWFDGHTVSKGPWVVHAAANSVHIVAAAVWSGGVFAMATIAWTRRRAEQRSGMAAMVVRFSDLATVSLVAVIAAGLVMALLILDRPGDLLGTEWGRLLLAKTAAVAVAAALGAFNHFRLRPALERRPDDPALARELRVTLTIEAVVFVVIIVFTAWLVAAAT